MIISLSGCVHYSHSAHTNIRQDSFDQDYQYLKTESLWVGFNYAEKTASTTQASENNGNKVDRPMTDEEKQTVLNNITAGHYSTQNLLGDPVTSISEPTFMQLTSFVKRKYGENAVVGNVVWAVKNTIFFWNFQKIESVTFDVYLKK